MSSPVVIAVLNDFTFFITFRKIVDRIMRKSVELVVVSLRITMRSITKEVFVLGVVAAEKLALGI